MLYTSFLRRLGPGLLWSYGPEAEAIALGTPGGGPDIDGHPQMPALSWEEFARDLRLARHFTDLIDVHSLEGCVWQGFLHGGTCGRGRRHQGRVDGNPRRLRPTASLRLPCRSETSRGAAAGRPPPQPSGSTATSTVNGRSPSSATARGASLEPYDSTTSVCRASGDASTIARPALVSEWAQSAASGWS